jgi:hypothetical protein
MATTITHSAGRIIITSMYRPLPAGGNGGYTLAWHAPGASFVILAG